MVKLEAQEVLQLDIIIMPFINCLDIIIIKEFIIQEVKDIDIVIIKDFIIIIIKALVLADIREGIIFGDLRLLHILYHFELPFILLKIFLN